MRKVKPTLASCICSLLVVHWFIEVITLARKPRVEYYGAIYHITRKGKNQLNIFGQDEDKVEFLSILAEAKDIFEFKLIAYCITDNQYNLIIKVLNIPISKVFQRVNMMYAKYFNNIYKKTGSPFQGRYKGNIINNDHELPDIVKHVHNIPVYLNIVDSMEEYKWSSDVFLRINLVSLVDIDYLLDILSDDRQMAINSYKDLMSNDSDEYMLLKKDNEHIESMQNNFLDEILLKVCLTSVDFDLIKKKSRKSYLMKYKQQFIKECSGLGFSNMDIALSLGITERAIRKHLYADKGVL